MGNKIYNNLVSDWKDSRWLSFVLKIIALVGIMSLCIMLIVWILKNLVAYIRVNFDWIVLACIVCIFAINGIRKFGNRKNDDKPEKKDENPIQKKDMTEQMEINYQILRDELHNIAKRISCVLKILCPDYAYEIESDKHCVQQGNIFFYEYILYKTAECSVDIIKSAIQQEIDRDLKGQRIIGISQIYHHYEGQPYSFIKVHSIEDCKGFYRIRLVIVTDDYCRYIQHDYISKLSQSAVSLKVPTDSDF